MKAKTSNPKQTDSNAAALRAAALKGLLKKRNNPTPKNTDFSREDLMAIVRTSWNEKNAWMEKNKPPREFGGPFSHDSAELKLQSFIWKCLNEPTCATFPVPGTTWRDYAPEILRDRLNEVLRHLIYLSKTDARAIEHLAESVISMTESLNKMPPEKLRPVARQNFFWPFLEAKKGRSGDRLNRKRLLEAIQLGRAAPFSEKAIDRISPSRPAAKEAMRLLCRLEESRKPVVDVFCPREYREWQHKAARLKPLSQATWQEWSQIALESLLDDHKGQPENDPVLRAIGQSGTKPYQSKLLGQRKATPKTDAFNVRQRITDAIRDVIRTLADCPRKPRKNSS